MNSPDDFDWWKDAFSSFYVAVAALREQGIREGRIAPETDTERRWAAEGPRPVQELEAGRT